MDRSRLFGSGPGGPNEHLIEEPKADEARVPHVFTTLKIVPFIVAPDSDGIEEVVEYVKTGAVSLALPKVQIRAMYGIWVLKQQPQVFAALPQSVRASQKHKRFLRWTSMDARAGWWSNLQYRWALRARPLPGLRDPP
eukprot:SAG11_NODE_4678_length_1809_cov_1.433918_1_plen_138_part_00